MAQTLQGHLTCSAKDLGVQKKSDGSQPRWDLRRQLQVAGGWLMSMVSTLLETVCGVEMTHAKANYPIGPRFLRGCVPAERSEAHLS